MERFQAFEREVVKTLVEPHIPAHEIERLLDSSSFVAYQYTGSGYYLTVRHPSLPSSRVVCDRPLLVGKSGTITCGFVVFLQNGELTLECHAWGAETVPEDFRARRVNIEAAA